LLHLLLLRWRGMHGLPCFIKELLRLSCIKSHRLLHDLSNFMFQHLLHVTASSYVFSRFDTLTGNNPQQVCLFISLCMLTWLCCHHITLPFFYSHLAIGQSSVKWSGLLQYPQSTLGFVQNWAKMFLHS